MQEEEEQSIDPVNLTCPMCRQNLKPWEAEGGISVSVCTNDHCSAVATIVLLENPNPVELGVSHVTLAAVMLNIAANCLYVGAAPENLVIELRNVANSSMRIVEALSD